MREGQKYQPPKDVEELSKRYGAGERYFPHTVLSQTEDLSNVDLTGADFSGSDFAHVRLLNTTLRNTNLRDSNLKDTSGLSAAQLGGAKLSGAKLPNEIKIFDGLKNVEELSKHAGNLFFSLLLACVYGWLTIGTTTDALLLTNSASSPLPIVGAAVPIVAFYLAAPLFLLGLYIYLHLNLQRLWEGLADLPAIFPDGSSLDKRAYPWLLNGLVCAYFPRLRESRPSLSRLQVGISVFVAWWLGPLTMLLFWARYLRRHDWPATILLVVLVTVSISAAITLYGLAGATLRGERRKLRTVRETLKDSKSYKGSILMVAVALLFCLLSFGAIDGIRPDFASAISDSPLTRDLKTADPRLWVPRAFALLGYNPFADLREADVSQRPPTWNGVKENETALVKRARLRGKNLRYADAYRAFMVGADLNGANLQGAYLFQANLRGADLMWADLQEAFLSETDLQNANLQKANLRAADLSGANLKGARMAGAILSASSFDGADIRGADLTDAAGLTRKQISSARLDQKTRLPDYLGAPEPARPKK